MSLGEVFAGTSFLLLACVFVPECVAQPNFDGTWRDVEEAAAGNGKHYREFVLAPDGKTSVYKRGGLKDQQPVLLGRWRQTDRTRIVLSMNVPYCINPSPIVLEIAGDDLVFPGADRKGNRLRRTAPSQAGQLDGTWRDPDNKGKEAYVLAPDGTLTIRADASMLGSGTWKRINKTHVSLDLMPAGCRKPDEIALDLENGDLVHRLDGKAVLRLTRSTP